MFGQSGSMDFEMPYGYHREPTSPYTSDHFLQQSKTHTKKCYIIMTWVLLAFFILISIGLAIAVAILAIRLTDHHKNDSMKELCETTECIKIAGTILSKMDTTVDPCEDFFTFSCGNWIKNNPVPVTSTIWGQFELLSNKLNYEIRDLLENDGLFNTSNNGQEQPKIVLLAQEFYQTCLSQNIQKDYSELQRLFESIFMNGDESDVNKENANNLTHVIANLRRELDGNYIFTMYVAQDEMNSSRYSIYIDQPTFGIPMQYLTSSSDNYMKKNYLAFINYIWKEVFPQDAAYASKISQDIFDFETQLANISTPSSKRRNKTELYNMQNIKDIEDLTDTILNLNWTDYFRIVYKDAIKVRNLTEEGTDLGTNSFEFAENDPGNDFNKIERKIDFPNLSVVVKDAEYLKKLKLLLGTNSFSEAIIKNYFKWRIIFDYGSEVNNDLRDAFFDYAKITQGLSFPPSRWMLCVQKTNALLGMAVSHLYTKKYFDFENIGKVDRMVKDLMSAFDNLLKELDWLDLETKEIARKKAKAIKSFIGYPNWLEDVHLIKEHYYGLDSLIAPENHFLNFLQIVKWHFQKQLRKIFQPHDPNEWMTNPTVVNAFYYYSHNSINLPAAIFQPPFFKMPLEALNYGAIGSIIGHEITHGFDDSGRQSDLRGNLKNWWKNETLTSYLKQAQCFEEQYGNYTLKIDDTILHLDGINTLSENIADNGGLRQAYEAYKIYTLRHGKEGSIPGLSAYTSEQLFFIAYGQIWCASFTPSSLREQVFTGQHSPQKFRVKGTLENFKEFDTIWNCPKKINNSTRQCRIW